MLVPAATAGADAPSAHCTYSVPKTVKLKKLVRPGLPVKVTCDAAAKVGPLVMFKGGTRQERKWNDIHNHGIPGIDKSGSVNAAAGQTVTVRAKLWKPVAKFLKKYKKTKLKVLLGIQEPGQNYFSSIDSGKTFTVVR